MRLGPDSARYVLAGQGHRVARPFHLRWLLPFVCRDVPRRWWIVWSLSWPLTAAAMVVLALGRGLELGPAVGAAALLVALPGLLGPVVVRPVGVDLPALAVGLWAAALLELGWWPAAVVLVLVAGSVKESTPVFAALWAWHPLLLVGLLAPAIRAVCSRPELDPVTAGNPTLLEVHNHPVRTALEAHRDRARDAWLWLWPWGASLAALVRPSVAVVSTLVAAHAQLLVATDTVRLLHTAAGPVVALAAAEVIPGPLLILAAAASFMWWRRPELI